jgi:hypothetical protein
MVSFSQLPAIKKDIIFGSALTKFGPSYFSNKALGKNCLFS